MSEEAKKARAAMKAKAKRLASAGSEKVDSSDWTPSEPINADVKTGMRPVSRRAYRTGGKVEGEAAKAHAGKKPRKSGGRAIANALVNRNDKEANEEREGKKHIGGMKSGGRAKRENGGAAPKNPPMPPRRSDYFPEEGKAPEAKDLYSKDDLKRLEAGRKSGGRAKKMDGGGMDPRLGIVKDSALPGYNQMTPGMKKGGKIKHDDEKADKALIKKLVKPSARTGKAAGGDVDDKPSKYLGAGRKGDKSVSDAEKEYGPREEWETRVDNRIKNEFSPAAMRKMRAERAIRMAADKGLQEFTARKKARDDKDSMEKAGYKAGGRSKRATGGMIEDSKKAMMIKADPHNQSKIKPAEPKKEEAAEKKYGGKRVGKFGGGAMMGAPVGAMGARMAGRPMLGRFGQGRMPQPQVLPAAPAPAGVFPANPQTQVMPVAPMPVYNTGGRVAKKSGGRAKGKGKTNINIVISGAGGGAKPQGGMPMPMPAPGDAGPAAQLPMQQGGPQQQPPGMDPAMMAMLMQQQQQPQQPPMARKSGGRVSKVAKSYKDMEAGSASGEGRLQKTDIAKRTNTAKKENGDKTFTGKGYPNKVPGATGGRTARKAGGMIKMHAGAGSGEGRLEKTEHAKRK